MLQYAPHRDHVKEIGRVVGLFQGTVKDIQVELLPGILDGLSANFDTIDLPIAPFPYLGREIPSCAPHVE
jgi:hypothetical protein